MVVGGGWANPLQTLSQGPLLTFRKIVQELTRTWEDPELDKNRIEVDLDDEGT